MSAEGDQQRRPGAPDDSDGKRRLRAVSYPDPYLVTKLPLEGTVNSGVIRLGERMLLGFIHRPYPDGTRVRVVYDEWLFAERLEEPAAKEASEGEKGSEAENDAGSGALSTSGEESAIEEAAGAKTEGTGVEKPADGTSREKSGPKNSRPKKTGAKKTGPKKTGPKNTGPKNTGQKETGSKKSDTKGSAAKESSGAPGASGEGTAEREVEPSTGERDTASEASERGRTGGAGGSSDRPDADRFPEEFNDPERRSSDDQGGQDAWTDAFKREDRKDS